MGRANIDRFPACDESVLPTKYSDYSNLDFNPFPKPITYEKEFGKFDVALVSNEMLRLGKVNLGK